MNGPWRGRPLRRPDGPAPLPIGFVPARACTPFRADDRPLEATSEHPGGDQEAIRILDEGSKSERERRPAAPRAAEPWESRLPDLGDPLFHAFIDNLPYEVFIRNSRSRFVLVNREWERVQGLTCRDVIGKSVHEIYDAALANIFQAQDRQVLETGDPIDREVEVPSAQGLQTFRTVKFPVSLPNRAEPFVCAIVLNMTKSKQAEESLRQSEGLFRAVVDNSPTKIHIKDTEGRYILVNRVAEALFGVSDAEARGKTTDEIFPRETAEKFVAHDAAVLESGEAIEQEEEWAREDGVHTYLTVKFPIRDPAGRPIGVGAIGTDITTHKKAAGLSQRLGRILDGSFNEVYLFDAETYRFVQVSQGALNNLGYSMDELRRMTPWHLKPEYDAESFKRAVAPLQRGEVELLVFETEHRRKDGSLYPVEVRLQLSRAESPAIFVAILADISQRKTAEDELKQRVSELEETKAVMERQNYEVAQLAEELAIARDQAEAANRAKSEFLATMSHELRTPLNAIIGFSEIIQTESLGPIDNDKYRDYAGDIQSSGQHLLELINDILDLSKIESGMDELSEEVVDIAEIVQSVSTLVRQRAERQGVRLAFELEHHFTRLRADRRKVKQILVNLTANAIKFTDQGGRVTIKSWSHPESGCVLQVIDSGIGIALADIPKALSQFGQIDSSLSRQHPGTGLGLPLAKAMIEMHGGSLDLQSKPGVGTTVTLRFPAERIIEISGLRPMAESAGGAT